MKVYLNLSPKTAPPDNGIGQVVRAQWKHLPDLGIELVETPDAADVVACHVQQTLPGLQVDVLHCHGLYFEDVPHAPYTGWHVRVNKDIAASVRKARIVTVPSEWVAKPFQRDLRIAPKIIPHGIEFAEWNPAENLGYALWNKGRALDVCDPTPAWQLAKAGNLVVTTFPPPDKEIPESLKVVGLQPFDKMRELVQSAGLYIATTLETFGIGTIEALAAGVPVLGYDWGGASTIIQHEYNGFLVRPGGDLREGYAYIMENRARLSKNARESAKSYDWKNVVAAYADLYREAHTQPKETGWSIVITNFNYGKWVGEAIRSALTQVDNFQAQKLDRIYGTPEIIVVDDGSTDDSRAEIARYSDKVKVIIQENQGVAAARNNGIAAASGSFITCLDADDRLTETFGTALLPVIAGDRAIGVTYGTIALMNDDGGDLRATNWPGPFMWEVQAEFRNPPATNVPTPSACIFRRDMWSRSNGYRQEFAPGEDTEFMTRSLSMGWEAVRGTEEVVTHYRLHGGSASKDKKYTTIEKYLPWVVDKIFPFAAPTKSVPRVFSYMNPTVSIIIPVGPNHTKKVCNAIESVIGQTVRSWELIIVVDVPNSDGRDEDIAKIKKWYPFADLHFTWDAHGAGAARNIGLEFANAPLTIFLDADDRLTPTALAELLETYTKTGFYVYCDSAIDNGSGSFAPLPSMEYNQGEWQNQHSITALIETKVAKEIGFDETLASWEDWDFFLKMQIRGYCGIRVAKPLLIYDMTSGSRRKSAVINEETTELGKAILEKFKSQYGDYFTGVKTMSSCCGGSADIILAAKRAMNPAAFANMDTTPAVEGSVVRMVFIGEAIGSVTYPGNNGRSYRAGNNPVNKYIDARAEDVEKLLSTSHFEVIQVRQAPTPDAQPAAPVTYNVTPTTTIAQKAAQEPTPAGLFSFLEAAPGVPNFKAAPADKAILPGEAPGDTPMLDFLTETPPTPPPAETPKPVNKGGRPKKNG